MPRQSISLTPPNDAWLKAQVESEEFTSKSEVVNDLIRKAAPTYWRKLRKKRGGMATYRLTENAKEDLRRIYRRGLREYGEAQADQYYNALFDRFEQIAEQPFLYPAVDDIREGYRRSVCGVDSIYYRIEGETVEIMAIIGRQDLEEWL